MSQVAVYRPSDADAFSRVSVAGAGNTEYQFPFAALDSTAAS